jgi:ABC-type antimicrobial peptide transport system permease subunit
MHADWHGHCRYPHFRRCRRDGGLGAHQAAALDPTVAVGIESLQQHLGGLAQRPRFDAFLLSIFASIGLLPAVIGLYGVVSFLVAQRTSEIGVRMVLGATPPAIAAMVPRQAARSAGGGILVGTLSSLFALRLLGTMLYRVPANDPWTLGGVLVLLAGLALLVAWVPSQRAARVNPVEALRQD